MERPLTGARHRISVVIPAHDAEPYIEETLQSVLDQRRKADEIIVVDDFSSDSTAAIARRMGARVVRPARNIGCAGSRNIGIESASGDLIALLDADDIWLPDHLASLEALMLRFPQVVLAYSRAQLFGDVVWTQEAWLEPGVPSDALWESVRRNIIIPSGAMVRAAAVHRAGGFDESLRLLEDFEYWKRLAQLGMFVCAEQITLRYRKHGSQASRKIRECRKAEYGIRRRWIEQARRHATRTDYERTVQLTREAWNERVEEAWYSRSWRTLLMTLRLGVSVPGSLGVLLRWSPRLALFPALPLWDRLRRKSQAARARSADRPPTA